MSSASKRNITRVVKPAYKKYAREKFTGAKVTRELIQSSPSPSPRPLDQLPPTNPPQPPPPIVPTARIAPKTRPKINLPKR